MPGQPPPNLEPSQPPQGDESEAAARELLEDAIVAARDAAITAFTSRLGDDADALPEVRLMVTATRGNPSTGYSESEVRFAAPEGIAISHSDKVAMALASMKAVAPDLYATMVAGIERGRRTTIGGLRACLRLAGR